MLICLCSVKFISVKIKFSSFCVGCSPLDGYIVYDESSFLSLSPFTLCDGEESMPKLVLRLLLISAKSSTNECECIFIIVIAFSVGENFIIHCQRKYIILCSSLTW